MRIFYITCSVISIITSLALSLVLRWIWKNVATWAWFWIVLGYLTSVANNVIIGYLVIFRSQPLWLVRDLLIIYFINWACKNIEWLIGFFLLKRYFDLLG